MREYAITALTLLANINFYSTCASDNPIGHLKPFGFHKPPSVLIDEYTINNSPDPKTFFENHLKQSKAAIFRGAVKDSDAYKLWNDEYLRENFGDMEVRLEEKWEKTFLPPIGEKYLGRDTIRHFADHYHGTHGYVVSDLPSAMYYDVGILPSLGACGEMSRRFVEIDIWWSGGDGRSLIHKDAYNQMNCLLNGTKYWKLIEYKYEKYLYKHPEPEYEVGGFSDVNPREVDLLNYPDIGNVEWSNFTMYAGDCLYLPKSYYHQVDSVGTHNLAVSILFGRFDNRTSLDFSDCTNETDYRKLRRLSEFDVQWPWSGTGIMVMGRGDLEDQYRAELLEITRNLENKGKIFSLEVLEYYLSPMRRLGLKPIGDFDKAFKLIDRNTDGNICEEEVLAMTTEDLRNFGDEVEPYEPSSSYDFEYSIITYGTVLGALEHTLSNVETLDRESWLEIYKQLGGTEQFGLEIYSRLAGKKATLRSRDVTEADIEYALENWKIFLAPQYSSEIIIDSNESEEAFHGNPHHIAESDEYQQQEIPTVLEAYEKKDEL